MGELGKDLYKFGKKQIKQLYALMRDRGAKTRVLVFQFEIRPSSPVQVEVFITNATESEIEGVFKIKVSEVEQLLQPLASNPAAVKIVAEYSKSRVVPKFMLRADGVPFDLAGRLVTYKGNVPNGISISFEQED